MGEPVLVGIITAAAAIIGGTVGAISSYMTSHAQIRASVRSENRQEWINTVRNTISEIQAIAITAMTQVRTQTGGVDELSDRMERLWFLHQKLELLLNPTEVDHRRLMRAVREHVVARIVEPEDRKDVPVREAHESAEEITSLARSVLKREWERVKRGE